MAVLNFPNAPTDGQIFPAPNGVLYRWDAGAHVWLVWGSGSNVAIVGSMPPSNPTPGQLWWSDELGQLFIFYDDSSSQQWVPASPVIFEPYLPLSGGTLEGDLEVEGDISAESVKANTVTAASGQVRGNGGISAGGQGVYYDLGGHHFAWTWNAIQPHCSVDGSSWIPVPRSTNLGQIGLTAGGGPVGWSISAWDSGLVNVFWAFADGFSSDARLKKNIVDTTVDALAAINAVPVRSFTWKGEWLTALQPYTAEMASKAQPVPKQRDTPAAIGLVAQEVRPHIPEMVSRSPVANRNRALPNDLLYLNNKEAVPYLIRAIQQLTARVATLEAKVT